MNCFKLPPPIDVPKNQFLIQEGIFSSRYIGEPIDGGYVEIKYQVFANLVVGRESPHKYDSSQPRYRSEDILLFEVRGMSIEESFSLAKDILYGHKK